MKINRYEVLGRLLQEGNINLEEFLILIEPEVKIEYIPGPTDYPVPITPYTPYCKSAVNHGEASLNFTPS